MENTKDTPNTERPWPIMEIYAGAQRIMSKSMLYELRDSKRINFYYLGTKPYVYMSEINAAMTTKDIHQ